MYFAILAAIGGFGYPLLQKLRHGRVDWTTLTFFIIVSFAILVVGILAVRNARQAPSAQLLSTAAGVVGQIAPHPATGVLDIDIDLFFRQTYQSTHQGVVESNLRSVCAKYDPRNREDVLYKLMARGIMEFQNWITWLTIYRSQILLILELNEKGYLGMDRFKHYYDAATKEFPDQYKEYPLERWISYLRWRLLVLPHRGDVFEITIGGKDFLKFMVHYSLGVNQRKL